VNETLHTVHTVYGDTMNVYWTKHEDYRNSQVYGDIVRMKFMMRNSMRELVSTSLGNWVKFLQDHSDSKCRAVIYFCFIFHDKCNYL
jgi:hypothetical protein